MISASELLTPLCRSLDKDVFVILVGYFDESASHENPPLTFGLSCVFAWGNEWPWIEMEWQKILEEKNAELRLANRRELKRFHATDMSNFVEEYEGWNGEERTAFTSKFIRNVFGRHEIFAIGHTVSLQDVADTWPNYAGNEKQFAYYSLMKINMLAIAKVIEEFFHAGTKISFIHDRCDHDGILLEAFNSVKNDPKYALRDKFLTIAAMGWEDCTLLQPADLFAYESMKEAHRLEEKVIAKKERPRRKSLEALLAKENFFPSSSQVSKEGLIQIRASITAKAEARIAAGEDA